MELLEKKTVGRLIQNLISKPELNGKICEKVETLDNGRVKIKFDELTLSECFILLINTHKKSYSTVM